MNTESLVSRLFFWKWQIDISSKIVFGAYIAHWMLITIAKEYYWIKLKSFIVLKEEVNSHE